MIGLVEMDVEGEPVGPGTLEMEERPLGGLAGRGPLAPPEIDIERDVVKQSPPRSPPPGGMRASVR